MNNQNNLPITIVIFGASGDLAHRKLIPALYNLFCKNHIDESITILGFSNVTLSDQDFRTSMLASLKTFSADTVDMDAWNRFSSRLFHMTGDFSSQESFQALGQRLGMLEKLPAGRLYYLATPPQFFAEIVKQLHQAGLTDRSNGWRRVIIEKPFGRDLASARSLNEVLHQFLDESQIYRIDHYLGKETVQNILVFRFGNTIFEPVWNRKFIDHVQITVSEQLGVEHRAGYYEGAGVLRDMFQNHILQLVSLIALEPPVTLKHEDLHARKIEVLKSLRPVSSEDVAQESIRGQYRGYRQEPGVKPDSQVATFGALRLYIDNPRWEGVPFFLRSGKSMQDKVTNVVIVFKCPPFAVYPMPPSEKITPDILSFCIQPDEGVYLRFEAKVPDTITETRSVEMEFHYSAAFGPSAIPEAYERLISDALHGDQALFTIDDQAELSWQWIDPIIAGWEGPQAPPLEIYEPGTWGPSPSSQHFLGNDRVWHIACGKHQDI